MFNVEEVTVSGKKGVEGLNLMRGAGEGQVKYGSKIIGKWRRFNGNYPLAVSIPGKNTDNVSGLKPLEAVQWLFAQANSVRLQGNIFPDKLYILRVAEMSLAGDMVTARIYYNSNRSTGSSSASTPAKSTIGTINLNTGKITALRNGTPLSTQTPDNEATIVAKIRALIDAKRKESA